MKFRVIKGRHLHDDGKVYVGQQVDKKTGKVIKKGDIVESDKRLDLIFREKFVPLDIVDEEPATKTATSEEEEDWAPKKAPKATGKQKVGAIAGDAE